METYSSPSVSSRLLRRYAPPTAWSLDVYERAVRLARQALDAPIAAVCLLDGEQVHFGAALGIDPTPHPIAGSLCRHFLDADSPVALHDPEPEEPDAASPVLKQTSEVECALGTSLTIEFPTTSSPTVVGALYVADTRPRSLSEAERTILHDLSATIKEELERQLDTAASSASPPRPSDPFPAADSAVERELRERERKVEALYREMENLLQSHTTGEVAARLEALVVDTLGYPLNAVRYVRDDELVPARVSEAIPTHMPDRPTYALSGDSGAAQAYRTGQTQHFNDIQTFDDPYDRGEARATAYVPIGNHGTISVASLDPHAIDTFDVRLLEILAGNAATVLDRIQRENQQRRTIDRIETLRNLSQSILSATSPEDVAQATLRRLSALIPYEQASVLEYDADDRSITLLAIDDPEALSERITESRLFNHFREDDHLLQTPRYVEDIPEESPDPVERYLCSRGIRSYLNVPLRTEKAVIGFLNLGAAAASAYDDEHVEIAREVADMLTVALRQARYREQLIEAKEEAEQMNKLKSAFLANMSHEIRTPLTSIVGFAEVLDDYDLGEANRFAELIERSGNQLLDTIDSVLDLSKLEAGAVSPQLETTEVVQEVSRVAEIVNARAEEAGVSLHTDLPSPPLKATLDPSAFRRILHNLLSNAIKFTDAGGSIWVQVERMPDQFAVTVEDTGRGIDEAFLPHLFDAFEQEVPSDPASTEGTGLGLAMTKRLVDLLEGSIDVESTKGEGTTFTVHLPRPPTSTSEPSSSS